MAQGLYEKHGGRVFYRGQDITGHQYGRITILSELAPDVAGRARRRRVYCRCACGKQFAHTLAPIVGGQVQSCGCLRGENHRTHGGYRDPLYGVYRMMKSETQTGRYKDRNLGLCPEWFPSNGRDLEAGYQAFRAWALANGYKPGKRYHIQRLDYAKGYSPTNCFVIEVAAAKEVRDAAKERLRLYVEGIKQVASHE